MESIKDTKFDVDKMIDSVIDYTELFLTGVKEVVKSGKELEEEKFMTYWCCVMDLTNILMSPQQSLFFTQLVSHLYEDGFFKSPASIKYHGNYRCGLVEHSIGVFYYMLKFYREMKDLREKYSIFDIMITALCHDLCKIGLYLEVKYDENTIPEGIKVNKEWPKFIKNNKRRSLGHGEQSIWTLKNYECRIKSEHPDREFDDIKFDVIEAIRWHMGRYDLSGYGESEYDRAKRNNKLVLVTHYADDLTSSWDNR